MKKTLLSLSLLTSALYVSAQTQVGNSDFEAWDNIGQTNVEPVNYNSFMNADIGSFFGSGLVAGKQVDRSTVKRPGSSGNYSAKIWARSILGVAANGNITCGKINVASANATDPSNHNKSVIADALYSEAFNDTPDSLVVWVKYKPVNTSSHQARVSCAIHSNAAYRDPNDLTDNTLTKAVAQLNFSYNGNTWQRLSIPFVNVNASLTPAFIITTFTTNKTPGVGSVGDSLYIDDMELVYVPKASFTASTNNICANGTVNFTSTSTNYPTSYAWNFGDGSAVSTAQNPSHQFTTAGTYNVTLTVTNQWGSTTSTTYVVTVNAVDNANFTYTSNTICLTGSNQTPTVGATGTFTVNPSTGLNFVSTTTGEINIATSTAGTYDITYTTNGACPNTSSQSITLTNTPDATFTYANASYCSSATDPSPVFGSGANGGAFTASPSGLTINGTSGIIDLSASTAGAYTVTNTIAASGACPASTGNFSITILASPVVALGTFNNVCTYTPAFALTGGTPAGGTYSGTGVTAGNFNPSAATVNANTQISYVYSDGTCSNTATSNIYVSDCLGMTETENTTITVSPNPTNGKLIFTHLLETTPIQVFDMAGALVYTTEVSPTTNEISCESWVNGMYMIRLNNQMIRIVKN